MIAVFFIGRLILGGYFLYSAYMHFTNVKSLTGYAQTKGVPFPRRAVIVSGVLFLLGGLSIVLGLYMVYGMALLAIVLIPITFMMHSFWKKSDHAVRSAEIGDFLKNMALIGALMIMVSMAYIFLA